MRNGTLAIAAILALTWMPHALAAPRGKQTEGSVGVNRAHGKVGEAYSGVSVTLPNMRIQSTVFVQSPYSKGAAHPNTFFLTKNFDPMSGQEYKLKDLFKPGTGWLKAISRFSRKDLSTQTGIEATDDWLRRGTAARPGNFSAWSVSKQGLDLHFGGEQVGPHALGPQIVTVPWKELRPFVKRSGPIGRMGEGKAAK
jgi:hypothetical protein